jgi:hypothetical protein
MRALILSAAAALLLIAGPAAAAEVSRSEYVAAVEPICKANTRANERILKNVRTQVRKGKLRLAARSFAKAGTALMKAYRQLRAVPQPTGDEARLAKWLRYVKIEADLFKAVSRKLKAGKRGAAQAKVNRLTTNANLANSTVLAFNFRYCRFQPSKFT